MRKFALPAIRRNGRHDEL